MITPEPWLRRYDDQRREWVIYCGSEERPVKTAGTHIAYVGALNGRHRDADAALIAAAPLLLEACKRAGNCLEWIDGDEEVREVMDFLRAALVKAEPEEPRRI